MEIVCENDIIFVFIKHERNRHKSKTDVCQRKSQDEMICEMFTIHFYRHIIRFVVFLLFIFFLFWVNLFSDGNGQRAEMSFQRIYYVSFIAGFDDGVIWSMIVTSLWTSFKISCPTKLCPSHLIKLSNWKKRWFPYCSASLWSYSLHVIIRCYTHLDGTSWPK